MKVSLTIAALAAVAQAGTYGFDISEPLSVSNAQCMKDLTYDFVSVRAWHSYGAVDTAACGSLKNAKTAGITTRDVYMFPCPTCSASARTQIDTMINYLTSNCDSAWSGKIWLDIEGTQYWYSSYSTNKSWY